MTKPPRNQTRVEWNVVAKARQEPVADGSQKRARHQRAHFIRRGFGRACFIFGSLLFIQKAKQTRAIYLSFFAFIFPTRIVLHSGVALCRAGAAPLRAYAQSRPTDHNKPSQIEKERARTTHQFPRGFAVRGRP